MQQIKAMKETILIIEDDAGLIELLSEKVQECGYNTASMLSAASAFKWLAENEPFLILLDYSLPDMNGKEFIAELKTKDKPVPPFLMTTGRGDERIAVDMMKLGARDCIIKGVNFIELVPLVISKVCKEIDNENKIKLIEKALAESNQFNRQIIESAKEGIVVYDKNLNCITWNPFMENITGVKSSEVLGKCATDIFPFLTEVGAIENIEKALQGMVVPEFEFAFNFPYPGKSGWISDSLATLRNAAGEVTGVISTLRDITERKMIEVELKESRGNFKNLFDYAPVGYHEIDAKGRIVQMNQTELNMHGCTSDEIIGKFIWEIAHNESEMRQEVNDKLNGRNDSVLSTETILISKTGIKYNVLIFDRILRDNDGTITGIRSTIQDITERKQAEEALRESEELYKTISENSNSAILIINEFSKIEWVNQNLLTRSGYSNEQILGAESFAKFIAPECLEFASSNFGKVISGKEYIHHYHLSVICHNGERRLCDKYMTHFVDRYGKLKVIVIMSDVTERDKVEKALKESKNVLNRLLHASTDFIDSGSGGINYLKLTDIVLEISGAKYATFNLLDEQELEFTTVAISGLSESLLKAKNVFGYELVNKKWKYDALKEKRIKNNAITRFDTIHDLTGNILSKAFITFIERTFHIGETFVVKILKNDKMIGDFTLLFAKGNTLRNHEIVELFANQTGLYIDREKTDKALRISEEKFRSITEQISDCISICDNSGIIYYASPASESMFQHNPKDILGRCLMEFVDDEFLPRAMTALRVGIKDKKKTVNIELKLKRKDGSTFFAELNGTNVLFGNEDRILVIVHDITERKKTVDALRASEDKYRTMIENSNDLIWMLDIHGNFTFVNEMSINTTGFTAEEWIGKSFVPLVLPEDLPMVKDVFLKSVAGENCNYELRLKKADESILTLSVNTSPIYIDGNIKGTVSFGRNITDRKLAEEALRESEELYRNLVQRIPDGVYKSTNEGKFVDVNPAMVHMLGYESKEEMLAIDIKSQLYFDSSDRESLVLKEEYEEVGVFKLRKKDGTGIWIEDHGWYNVDENGNILFHEGILRDITERKLAEQALEEKMEQLLRFHKLTVDRELTMIELKKEINRMLINAGQPEKYRIVE
ncbi:MAG TPA: PAS domain S-box protein [Paludibacter sp.]|nr:PAS domain S-box protein [Paludibacter sp.]